MNKWFVATAVFVFGIAVLPLSRPGAGWFWETGNGFGLAALVTLLYLCLDTRRGGKVRAHQVLGYLAVVLLIAHVLWFLIGDPTVLQYALPGAPWAMWSAWLSLLLLCLLVISSLPQLRPANYDGHSAFKRWHRWLTVLLFVAIGHHLIDSAFYLASLWHWLALAALASAAIWLPLQRVGGVRAVHPVSALALVTIGVALFIAVKDLAL